MRYSGQGAIEYLLVVAVILVFGLFVVQVTQTFFLGTANVSRISSRIYWGSQSISIIDAGVDSSGNSTFVFSNNSSEPVFLTKVFVGGEEIDLSSKYIAPLDRKSLDLVVSDACMGQSGEYSLDIFYTENGIEKKIIGTEPLLIYCSDSINVNCKKFGESVSQVAPEESPLSCCPGLDAIGRCSYFPANPPEIMCLCATAYFCSKCWNGVCDDSIGENTCNCSADCPA